VSSLSAFTEQIRARSLRQIVTIYVGASRVALEALDPFIDRGFLPDGTERPATTFTIGGLPMLRTPDRPVRGDRALTRSRLPVARVLALLILAAPACAESQLAEPGGGTFIVRLGLDTTAVEQYTRTADRIEAVSVSRSPRTVVRRLTVWLDPDGSITRWATGGETGEMRESTPSEPGMIPLAGGFYLPWALALEKSFRSGGDTTDVTLQSGNQAITVPVIRLAPDRYALSNQFDQAMEAYVDRDGRLQYLALAGGGATVERVDGADIDALAADFAARDAAGSGLGPLSPADTARATIGGASLSVIYSRPALRGRDPGILTPDGQVWRTGANAATELRTDRPLRFGDVSLAPGSYSIFTIPAAEGWTLILNAQTGQSGLEHDASRDVGRVPMTTRRPDVFVDRLEIALVPAAGGGTLRIRWASTEADAAFSVGR